jgi:hypothetical protein
VWTTRTTIVTVGRATIVRTAMSFVDIHYAATDESRHTTCTRGAAFFSLARSSKK